MQATRSAGQIKSPFIKLASVTAGVSLIAAGLFLTASRACADDTITPSPASGKVAPSSISTTVSDSAVSATDREFLAAASMGSMTEVKLGELAAQNGMSQAVKDFGAMMAKDHTTILDNLKELAEKKSVALTDTLDEKHQAMVDKLGALTGVDFDKVYIADMLKGHKKDLKAFEAEATATQDPDIKSFVDKTVPTISAHLQHITDIKASQP